MTIYEANDYVGGHTHTHDIHLDGQELAVDTGFIVFNRSNYPNFSRLLDQLGVASRPTAMSFSVRCEHTGLEYNGTSVNRLFAQRRNLLRPSFLRMVADILRFNRDSPRLLLQAGQNMTLEDYVVEGGYSREFRNHYLVPMCAALWSAPPHVIEKFPIHFLVRFFHNHGMLAINDRPQWLVVQGGSRTYVDRLLRQYSGELKVGTPVTTVSRHDDHIEITAGPDNYRSRFDHIIMACHSDQALRLITDACPAERDILGAIPYQTNEVVLHTDPALLPQRRLARASWNYQIPAEPREAVSVTYDMNSLQGLRTRQPICVTLNRTETVSPDKIIKRLHYAHPLFTPAAVAAQQRWHEISGHNRTHYCGAYWGNGFHEDGVNSALSVCKQFGASL